MVQYPEAVAQDRTGRNPVRIREHFKMIVEMIILKKRGNIALLYTRESADVVD